MSDKSKQWLWNILSSGLPTDYDLEPLRKIILLNLIVLICIFFLILYVPIAFIRRYFLLSAVDLFNIVLGMCLFFYLRKTKNYNFIGKLCTVVTGIFYFFLVASGAGSKITFIWSVTYPLISLFLLGKWWGSFLSLLLLGMICTVFAIGTKVEFFTSYRTDLIISFIPLYVIVLLFAFVVEKVREIVRYRLEASNWELEKTVGKLESANKEKEMLIHELQETMKEVQILQGILPICANCKKIRDDGGYWEQVEKYIQDRSEAQFSHGICPECAEKLYPEFYKGE